MNNRIGWIDAAKGVGIFLVVFGHMYRPGRLTTVIWAFHMPLFFFLSGITARPTSYDSIRATLRGLRSIATPYIFFSAISIAVWAAANQMFFSVDVWGTELRQMLYGVSGPDRLMRYNVPLWFFACLLSVKLLFAVLTMVVRSRSHQFAAVTIMALIAHAYIFPTYAPLLWNFDVALSAMVFYVAGFAFSDYARSTLLLLAWKQVASLTAAAALFGAAVYFNGRVDMNGRSFGEPALFYIGAFAGILLVTWLSTKLDRFSSLKTVGRASIVIFPLHALFWLLPSSVNSIARWYAFRLTRSDLASYAVVSFIEIAVCVPVYFLLLRWAPFFLGQRGRRVLPTTPLTSIKAAA